MKRVMSEINGRKVYNVYDASGKLVHVHDDTPLDGGLKEETDYITAGGMAIARVIKGQGYYYEHSDHLGSPVAQSYVSGPIATRTRYMPYGLDMDDHDRLKDQGGFTGHIKDSATGLNYMQARYYDPVMGRFLSIDPVTFMETGNPSFFNRYRYCASDPVNCSDPTGMIDVFIGGAEDDRSKIVSNYRDAYQKQNPGRTTAYFGHNQRKEASNFIKSAVNTEGGGKGEPVNIIGHSYGGKTATQVSRDVAKDGITVDNMVGVDPVNTIFSNTEGGSTVQNTITVNGVGDGGVNGPNFVEALGKTKAALTGQGGQPAAFRQGNADSYNTITADHGEFGKMFEAGAKVAIDESYK